MIYFVVIQGCIWTRGVPISLFCLVMIKYHDFVHISIHRFVYMYKTKQNCRFLYSKKLTDWSKFWRGRGLDIGVELLTC